MTKEEITQRIADIEEIKDDSEVAHSKEDGLYADFILAVAKGDIDPAELRELATLVLSTENISFSRWCA